MPNAPAPASGSAPAGAPASGKPGAAPAQAPAKAGAIPGQVAPQGQTPAGAHQNGDSGAPAKPEGVEAEIAAEYGEDWGKLPEATRKRIVAGEQKARDADKKYQLVAKIQKDNEMTNRQVGQLIEALKTDPISVLSNPALGHDVRKLAETYVWERIQEDRMSPEEREYKKTKLELETMKRQQAEQEEARKQENLKAEVSQKRAELERKILDTLKTENLPAEPAVIARVAYWMQQFARAKRPYDMPAIANQVRNEFIGWQQKFLTADIDPADPQFAEKRKAFLGRFDPKVVELLRKADLAELREKGLAPKPGPKPNEGRPTNGSVKKISSEEWLAQRDKRLGRA